MTTWKIARSFFLPIITLVGVPWAIHTWFSPLSFSTTFSIIAGILFVITGLTFLAWTNALFIAFGNGTLAPWDAPKKLVILGPYRYVRNPMIIAVITTLWGEALLFNSLYIMAWSLLFWLINHVYFLRMEEPDLERRFGDAYKRYKKQVPRWVPLAKPVMFDP